MRVEKTGLRITESAATGLCNSLLLAKLLELLLILSPLENLEKVKLNQDKKNGSKSWPGSPPHGSPPLGSSSPLLVNTCPERAVYPEKGERRNLEQFRSIDLEPPLGVRDFSVSLHAYDARSDKHCLK